MGDEATLFGLAAVTGIAFACLLLVAGVVWFFAWLISLVVLVVLRAFNPSHPIVAEEEID